MPLSQRINAALLRGFLCSTILLSSPSFAANEPSVEGLLSAKPAPSDTIQPLESVQTSVAPVPVKVVTPKKAVTVVSSPLVQATKDNAQTVIPASSSQEDRVRVLTEENAQLKRVLAESRKTYEEKQAQSQAAVVAELQEKVKSLDAENMDLKTTIASMSRTLKAEKEMQSVDPEVMRKMAEDLRFANDTIAQLKAENEKLKLGQESDEIGAVRKSLQVSQARAVALATENENLKAQIQTYAKVNAKPSASLPVPSASAQVDASPSSWSMSSGEFLDLLKSSGVKVTGYIHTISGGDPATYKAYSWQTGPLFGSVEMRKMASVADYDALVSQYLSRAKARCNGDFAAVESQTQTKMSEKSVGYEIACMNPSSKSSASVLFTYRDGVAMTIAHEGQANMMNAAIEARDRVASKL